MSGRLALMIDLERCTGCKSCEAACKQANRLGPNEYRNRVLWLADPLLPTLDFLTVTCQQCERPACVRACPVHPKALERDTETGVVRVNESRCTGCGECVLACPYGAMGYDPIDHHAVKCDLCAERREQGQGPACASVCPTRAIRFGHRDELLEAAEQNNRQPRDNDLFLQGPATVYLERVDNGSGAGSAIGPDGSDVNHLDRRTVPTVMADSAPRRRLTSAAIGTPYRAREGVSDRVVPGACHICFNACTVKYHLRGNRVVNVFGNDDDPVFAGRICPKSQMTLQLYDHPDRLVQPLKRVGERGEGRFEPVSWQRALDEISSKLSEIRDRHGAQSLAIQSGTRTGVLNIIGFMRMFARMWGTNNVATTEPFCDAGKVLALNMTLGSTNLPNIYTADDIGSAELYLYVGDNQAETRPVNFGMVNDWRVKNRARMVVVDPRLSATASKANVWLPIRPGTDMALALAMIYQIIQSELHDKDFCEHCILWFDAWRDYVLSSGYRPEWAASVTGLDADSINRLASDVAAADGCMMFLSRGINQHSNSVQTNRAYLFLAAITGNVGRKGGGYFNVAAEPDWMPIPLPEIAVANNVPPAVSSSPAHWLDAMIDGTPYPIRALITGNNPLAQWPDQSKTRQAFESLDLVVHMELFRNQTSEMADYVLPAATGIEKGGVSRLAEDRRIVWNERLIDPPGEARSDHWFWIELGKRFGYQDVLREEYKNPDVFWDEAFRKATPDLNGVSLARLRSLPHRWVRTPVAHDQDPQAETLYLPGTTAFNRARGQRFPTEIGKLEFYSDELEQRFQQLGLTALPTFYTEADQLIALPHLEIGDDAAALTSPFFSSPVLARPVKIVDGASDGSALETPSSHYDTELVTGRPPAPHFHSWTHYFWQAQEMWPELFCQLHPDKAHSIGVTDGERVRIESAQGVIEARAWVTAGIRKDAVFVPIGWDEQQPYHPAAPANVLTARSVDPVSQQVNLKLNLCRVSRT